MSAKLIVGRLLGEYWDIPAAKQLAIVLSSHMKFPAANGRRTCNELEWHGNALIFVRHFGGGGFGEIGKLTVVLRRGSRGVGA